MPQLFYMEDNLNVFKWKTISRFCTLKMNSFFLLMEQHHISASMVKISLHTKSQLPRLPRTALIVISSSVVVFFLY